VLGSIHDVDLRLLRIFVTIAESGGFSRAQAKLNLSQSAISTYMSQLETRLGTRLCRRGHGVFEITDDGQAVLQAAERLFASLGSFQAEVRELRGKLRGELRIGICDNSVTHPDGRMRAAINRFTARAPDVHVKVHVSDGNELEEQVIDGRLHLAAGIFGEQVASLNYSPLFEEEHLLYCGSELRELGSFRGVSRVGSKGSAPRRGIGPESRRNCLSGALGQVPRLHADPFRQRLVRTRTDARRPA